jgi:hypothetical protein
MGEPNREEIVIPLSMVNQSIFSQGASGRIFVV